MADQFAESGEAAGVKRVYGVVGGSLNGLTDALRRRGKGFKRLAAGRTERRVSILLGRKRHDHRYTLAIANIGLAVE